MNSFSVTNCRLNANSAMSAIPQAVSYRSNKGDSNISVPAQQNSQRAAQFDMDYTNSFSITSAPQQAEVKPYDQLERVQINDFNDLINIKSDLSNKQNWNIQFAALQTIRSVLKYHPEEVNNIYQFYGEIIVSIFSSNRTLMIKGCLALLSETFNLALTYRLNDEIISIFIKMLFQKLQNNTLKALDEWIKYVLSCFAQNSYDYDVAYLSLLAIPAQFQKKIQTTHIIEFLLDKKKETLNSLGQQTFITLVGYLQQQISFSSNKKLQGPYLKLCASLIEKIGENAFVQIMQHSLNNDQIQNMTTALQNYFKSIN